MVNIKLQIQSIFYKLIINPQISTMKFMFTLLSFLWGWSLCHFLLVDFLKKMDLLYYYYHLKRKLLIKMATLRNTFLQTFHTNNNCFSFLTTIPCILTTLLNIEERSSKQTESPADNKKTAVSQSITQLSLFFKYGKINSSLASTAGTCSMHEIMNNESCDFEKEKEEIHFVHVMDLINDKDNESSDIETVQSQIMSQTDFDPVSTQISFASDYDCSDVEDL